MLRQMPYVHSAAYNTNMKNIIDSLSVALPGCNSFPHSPKEVATLRYSSFPQIPLLSLYPKRIDGTFYAQKLYINDIRLHVSFRLLFVVV